MVELPAGGAGGQVMVHQSRVPNPDNRNSAIEIVLQVGPDGVHSPSTAAAATATATSTTSNNNASGATSSSTSSEGEAAAGEEGGGEEKATATVTTVNKDYSRTACMSLVAHLAKEPCFDDLRTKQQLGYLVFSGVLLSGDESVHSLRFIVQSEVQDPVYLDGRVEAFLKGFREKYLAE